MTKLNNLVSRKQSKELMKPLNMMGRLIDDFVDYGGTVFEWMENSHRNTKFDTPIFTTFIHFLDTLDSIATLTKKGSTSGVKMLLRSLFESSLAFQYMVTEPREKGVLAYQVAFAYQEIKKRRKIDPKDDLGKEFIPKLSEFLQGTKIETMSIKESAKGFYSFLEREEVIPVNDEWKRLKKLKKNREFNWYSLFNGPSNIRELSSRFDLELIYEVLYQPLSTHSHGSGTIKMFKEADGVSVLPGIRNPDGLQEHVIWTMNITMSTYQCCVRNLVPEKEKDHLLWYKQEVLPVSNEIVGKNLFAIQYYTK
jgi:hypothetical protein